MTGLAVSLTVQFNAKAAAEILAVNKTNKQICLTKLNCIICSSFLHQLLIYPHQTTIVWALSNMILLTLNMITNDYNTFLNDVMSA